MIREGMIRVGILAVMTAGILVVGLWRDGPGLWLITALAMGVAGIGLGLAIATVTFDWTETRGRHAPRR